MVNFNTHTNMRRPQYKAGKMTGAAKTGEGYHKTILQVNAKNRVLDRPEISYDDYKTGFYRCENVDKPNIYYFNTKIAVARAKMKTLLATGMYKKLNDWCIVDNVESKIPAPTQSCSEFFANMS